MKLLSYVRWLTTEFFFTISIFSAILFGTYAAQIQTSNLLSTNQLAILSGTFFTVFAFSQLLSGFLINKISTRLLLGFSALLSGLGAMLFAHTSAFFLLMLSRVILGLGLGCTFVGVLYIIQLSFKETQFAFLSSLSQSISNIAAGVLAVFGGKLLYSLSYHLAFTVIGSLLMVSAFLIMLFLPGKPKNSTTDSIFPGLLNSLKNIFSKRNFWIATIYFSGIFATILTFADLFNVKYQVDVFNLTEYKAIVLNGFIPFGIALGGVLAGFLSSKLQRNQLFSSLFTGLLTLSLIGILYVNLPHGNQYELSLVLHILFGIGCGGAMLAFQEIQYTFKDPMIRPLANSLVLTIAYLFSGMILQPVVGLLIGNLHVKAFNYAYANTIQISHHESIFKCMWNQFDKGLFLLVIVVVISLISSFFFTKTKTKQT